MFIGRVSHFPTGIFESSLKHLRSLHSCSARKSFRLYLCSLLRCSRSLLFEVERVRSSLLTLRTSFSIAKFGSSSTRLDPLIALFLHLSGVFPPLEHIPLRFIDDSRSDSIRSIRSKLFVRISSISSHPTRSFNEV